MFSTENSSKIDKLAKLTSQERDFYNKVDKIASDHSKQQLWGIIQHFSEFEEYIPLEIFQFFLTQHKDFEPVLLELDREKFCSFGNYRKELQVAVQSHSNKKVLKLYRELNPEKSQKSEEIQTNVLTIVNGLFPDLDPFAQKYEWRKDISQLLVSSAMPFLGELAQNNKKLYESMEVVGLIIQISGYVIKIEGNFSEGLQLLTHAHELFHAIYPQNHKEKAKLLQSIGDFYTKIDQLDKAKELLEESHKQMMELFPKEDSSELAESYEILSIFYEKTSSMKNAVEYAEKSLKLRRKLFPNQNHIDLVSSLDTLGRMHYQMMRDEDARIHFQEALQMIRAIDSKPSQKLAIILNNLSLLFKDIGRIEEAKKLSEEMLSIMIKLHGEDHPELASVYANLSQFETDPNRTLEILLKALKISKGSNKNLPPQLEEASILFLTGKSYQKLKDYQKAIDVYETVLRIRRTIYGDIGHPEIIMVATHLASVYGVVGDQIKAKENLDLALKYISKNESLSQITAEEFKKN